MKNTFIILKIISSLLLSIYASSTVIIASYLSISILTTGNNQTKEEVINSSESYLSTALYFIEFLFFITPAIGVYIIGPYIVAPCLAFIIITEFYKIIKLQYYIMFGALLGSVVILFIKWETTWSFADNLSMELAESLLIFAFAGVISGWIYWYLAGKHAGRFWPQPSE